MKPGDIVFKPDPVFGKHQFWGIEAVALGAEGQESLVKLRSLTHRPGSFGEATDCTATLVPEMLVRGHVFTPDAD